MNKIAQIIVLGLLSLMMGEVNAQESSPVKILFVGNSYTYFWNLPQTVQAFCKDENIIIRQSTAGGSNLGHHWNGNRGLTSKEKIQKGDYDIVILQDHSMRTIDHPDSLIYFGKLFSDLIREKGAQPLLYMTWSRSWDPYMIHQINKGYNDLGKTIHAKVVPVGLAWDRAKSLRPDLPLYDEDQSHPSTLGTYLTACVFYAVITGKSPVGLPERVMSEDKDGEKLYLNIQSKENALFCQKVALEIVESMPD